MKLKKEGEQIVKIANNLISSLGSDLEKGFDDGTGYIKSVKAIIHGLKSYMQKKDGLIDFEGAVNKRIYAFSKELWIKKVVDNRDNDAEESQIKSEILYYGYCFEYIFENGEYPL